MDYLLDIQDLVTAFHTYDGDFVAVNGVSLQVKPGEILGLVGESGCGKSVTSLSVMGLLPRKNSRIKAGRIVFDGVDLSTLSPREYNRLRGKDISMIFQEPMTSLNPVFTIENQLREAMRNHDRSLSKEQCRKHIIELLEEVGIPDPKTVIRQYPHQLSGGMRQRVMIAMAIANHTKLLIADEPTTALDVTIQAQILDLLKNLAKQEILTIILITHDLSVVAEMCDRVAVMYCGRIVEQAERTEFYSNPQHPYAKGLLACIPEIGMSDQVLPHIPGTVMHPADDRGGCSFAPRCSYATDRCREAVPDLYAVGEDHFCRCWLFEQGGING